MEGGHGLWEWERGRVVRMGWGRGRGIGRGEGLLWRTEGRNFVVEGLGGCGGCWG